MEAVPGQALGRLQEAGALDRRPEVLGGLPVAMFTNWKSAPGMTA